MHQALIPKDQIDDFIIVRVHALARKVQRAIVQEALAGEELPVLEWQLLFSFARFGSCHLAHVTGQTSIDPAHGSRAVAALERKGLVARRKDPANRRRKLVSLTEEGQRTFQRIWPRAQRVMQSVTDELDGRDFQDFKRLLSSVNIAADGLAEKGSTDPRTQEEKANMQISA